MDKKFQNLYQKSKAFIVAEISANHGKPKKSKKMIDAVKKLEPVQLKIQTYRADSMIIKSNKKILKLSMAYGKEKPFMIYMRQQKHLLLGTKVYLNILKKRKYLFFQHHLIIKV